MGRCAPPVWLDMQTSTFLYEKGRQLLSFALAALEAGHPVIVLRRGFFAAPPRQAPCIHTLLRLPGVFTLEDTRAIPGHALRIVDHPSTHGPYRMRRFRLHLCHQPPGEAAPLPFPMHSSILLAESHRFLDLARTRRRRLRILFAGRSPFSYRLTSMARSYGVMPRHRVLATVRRHFGDRCDLSPSRDEALVERPPEAPPIALIDARRWTIIPPCWLDRLGYASFFLCPPGALHPLSHHLVEAMSVGTVPILEYDQLLHPPLQDGVNCLAFRRKEGLLEAIERALAMDETEWEQLHCGAIDYYDHHLRYPQILEKHLAPESGTEDLALPFLHR